MNERRLKTSRTLAWVGAWLCCALLAAACSKTVPPSQLGGETNWLGVCEDGTACGQGTCQCGVCTKTCDSAHACSGAFAGACVALDSTVGRSLCASTKKQASAKAVCLPACSTNAECGTGYRCEQRTCVPDSSSASDAGSRGGTGGSSGTAGRGSGGAGTTGDGTGGGSVTGTGGGSVTGTGGFGVSGAPALRPTCASAKDCVLVPMGCCAACAPTKNDYLAVERSEEAAFREAQCPGGPPACGPCPPGVYDPLRPILRADCIEQHCTVVDERETSLTACTADRDCRLLSFGCCNGCGADPAGWRSLSSPDDPYRAQLVCNILCAVCGEPLTPEAFCASDQHCAVREIPRVNGVASSTCFSPTQNLDHAYDSGAVGCDCYTAGSSLCLSDSTGRKVALQCPGRAAWMAGQDGACAPMK